MFQNTISSEDQTSSVTFCMCPYHEWKECPGDINCLLTTEQIFSIMDTSKQEERNVIR